MNINRMPPLSARVGHLVRITGMVLVANIGFVGSAHAAPGDFTNSGQALDVIPLGLNCPAPATHCLDYSVDAEFSDLDGDGDLDAVVANAFGSTYGHTGVWLNDGAGVFSAGPTFGPSAAGEIAVGDLDGDGDPDVFVTASGPDEVWLNNGDGTFVDTFQALGSFGGNSEVRLADLDGDGDLDAFVSETNASGIGSKVFLNDGSATFTDSTQALAVGTGLALADMDGDGDIDAYLSCNCAHPNTLLFNDGSGVFTTSAQLVVGDNESEVDLADIDGDGDNDAYLVGGGAAKTRIWLNDGTGFLTDTGQAINTSSGSEVILEDLDGDGDLDAFSLGGASTSYVLLNNGTGVFSINQTLPTGGPGMGLGDVNGDGSPDVFVARARIANEVWLNEPNLAPNLPPTADAGADQAIRAGDTIFLDGSSSFDDNTASVDLLYSWTFSSLPAGSTATLADIIEPSFVADIPGTYTVQLIVTDEGGLHSDPDVVMVSSDNLAPTADAGNDQLVIVGTTVALDGSASSDPEMDSLEFSWTLVPDQPLGSVAVLADPTTISPSFVTDIEGLYTANLEVSDFLGAGMIDMVEVMATSADGYAEVQIMTADAIVLALSEGQITKEGNRKKFRKTLSKAIDKIIKAGNETDPEKAAQEREKAVNELSKSIERTDGCTLWGSPDTKDNKDDRGKPKVDWIIDCTAQNNLYALIDDAINALTP